VSWFWNLWGCWNLIIMDIFNLILLAANWLTRGIFGIWLRTQSRSRPGRRRSRTSCSSSPPSQGLAWLWGCSLSGMTGLKMSNSWNYRRARCKRGTGSMWSGRLGTCNWRRSCTDYTART
jgi:hypothetical protein